MAAGITHAFLTGRLVRCKQVENWIAKTQETKDTWFATLDEIAEHMDELQRDAIWQPSVETRPFLTDQSGEMKHERR